MSAVNATIAGRSRKINMDVDSTHPIRMTAGSIKRIDMDVDSTHSVRTTAGKLIVVDHDLYAGPYTVIPDQSMQVLETDRKNMAANVIVEPIPYYETSNEKGTTVYIGV